MFVFSPSHVIVHTYFITQSYVLDVFKFDEAYQENEGKYKTLSKEILDSSSGSEAGSEDSEESGEEEDEEEKAENATIIDNTETNLIALRRTIYLTIQSSLDFEECAHKLMKMSLKPGQEIELCHMFLGTLLKYSAKHSTPLQNGVLYLQLFPSFIISFYIFPIFL